MKNPFENVPLNTKKAYVMGKTWGGCEIYLPVDSDDHTVHLAARDNLNEYLATQPKPIFPDPEPRYA